MKTNIIFLLLLGSVLISCEEENSTGNNDLIELAEVTSFSVDSLEIDMIGNLEENALYFSYSPDNDINDNIMKYDLQNQSQIVEAQPDPTDSRQLIIWGNFIYSFGTADVIKLDLDLNNSEIVNSDYNIFFYSRAVQNGSSVYFPFGNNNLVSYNILDNTYEGTINSDPLTVRSDGAIVNNSLYSFGGFRYWTNPISDKLKIYDLTASTYSESTLPYPMYESFTATYEGNIIVAGNKNLDQSSAFIAVYDPILGTYSDLNTTLNLNSISIRSICVIQDELFIAYCEYYNPSNTTHVIKIAKGIL